MQSAGFGFKPVCRSEESISGLTWLMERRSSVNEIENVTAVKVNKGEVLGLIGESGAGKSTIVDLLLRGFDPDRGEVRIDGVPLREMTNALVSL